MSIDQAIDLLAKFVHYDETHRLEKYQPYPFQTRFHNAIGLNTRYPATQKALMCGNKVGKTYCAAMETAMHLTGDYPDWYRGPRYRFATTVLSAGVTNDTVRDIMQKELFGDPEDPAKAGTGTIPIERIGKLTRKAGVPNAFDNVQVKHKSGSWSKCTFRAYEQGWEKFMGFGIHIGWLDEEPPEEVWSQCIRATFATKGFLYCTFTPEKGMTKVVHQFVHELKTGQALIRATWDDAPHMSGERREMFLQQIPAHQREMRVKGIPMMGSGMVYLVAYDDLFIDPVELPRHWPRICGVDFGIGHAFAAIWLAWDRDTDTVYLYDEYRTQDGKMPVHVARIKSNGDWIPVAWPHDGLNREKSSGKPLADLYRQEGALMLPQPFSNPPSPGVEEGKGGHSVEFGTDWLLNKMQMDQFKIFKTCKGVREEIGMYHRMNGLIVKANDDLMDAMRYAALSLRHARTPSVKARQVEMPAGAGNW